MMADHYILIDEVPMPVDDVVAWSREFERANRTIKRDELVLAGTDVLISTVFLGLNHAYSDDEPLEIFETMIFGGPLNEDQWRYATIDEARAGHAVAIAAAMREAKWDRRLLRRTKAVWAAMVKALRN